MSSAIAPPLRPQLVATNSPNSCQPLPPVATPDSPNSLSSSAIAQLAPFFSSSACSTPSPLLPFALMCLSPALPRTPFTLSPFRPDVPEPSITLIACFPLLTLMCLLILIIGIPLRPLLAILGSCWKRDNIPRRLSPTARCTIFDCLFLRQNYLVMSSKKKVELFERSSDHSLIADKKLNGENWE